MQVQGGSSEGGGTGGPPKHEDWRGEQSAYGRGPPPGTHIGSKDQKPAGFMQRVLEKAGYSFTNNLSPELQNISRNGAVNAKFEPIP